MSIACSFTCLAAWGLLRPSGQVLHGNESAIISTLRNLCSSQAQLHASGACLPGRDGKGSYGYFAELAGAAPLAVSGKRLDPPLLRLGFADVHPLTGVPGGVVKTRGYYIQIWLPGRNGEWIPESDRGGRDPARIDEERAHQVWCVYAWPVRFGVTGRLVFFITQQGDVLASRNEGGRYSGHAAPDPSRTGRTLGDPTIWPATGPEVRLFVPLKDGLSWVVTP